MATRILVPANLNVPVGDATRAIKEHLPEDHEVCFVAVVSASASQSEKTRAQSNLIRRLMTFRTSGIKSEIKLVRAETTIAGMIQAAEEFGANEIMVVSGEGEADRRELAREIGDASHLPVTVAEARSREAPAV